MHDLRVTPENSGVPESSQREGPEAYTSRGVQAGVLQKQRKTIIIIITGPPTIKESVATSGPYLSVIPLPASSKRPAPTGGHKAANESVTYFRGG